jgi:hypothetical protein
MVVADRTERTENGAGGYGERLRVGLHFTQPNLLDRQISAIQVRPLCFPLQRV